MIEFPIFLDSQAGITNCGGLKDLYKRALLRFLADLIARNLPIDQPTPDEEWRRWIHSIKSTSALLGANTLNEIVKHVETYWRQNSEASLSDWNKLTSEYNTLRQQLEEWRDAQS